LSKGFFKIANNIYYEELTTTNLPFLPNFSKLSTKNHIIKKHKNQLENIHKPEKKPKIAPIQPLGHAIVQ